MTAALEGDKWSAARPGRTLPPGKTRYPFYRRLDGLQGRSWRAENFVPTGIRSWTVQSVISRYIDRATGHTHHCADLSFNNNNNNNNKKKKKKKKQNKIYIYKAVTVCLVLRSTFLFSVFHLTSFCFHQCGTELAVLDIGFAIKFLINFIFTFPWLNFCV